MSAIYRPPSSIRQPEFEARGNKEHPRGDRGRRRKEKKRERDEGPDHPFRPFRQSHCREPPQPTRARRRNCPKNGQKEDGL